MTHPSSSFLEAGREEQLLLWLCSVGLVRRRRRDPPAHTEEIDWQRFAALVQRHRVIPLVWRNFQKQQDVSLPDSVINELRQQYQQNAFNSLRITSRLVKILDALAAEGIPALPLKGVGMAALYYGDISSRFAGDIDLLIDPSHLELTDGVLRELGYARLSNDTHTLVREPIEDDLHYRHHLIYVDPDNIVVEPHFSLHNNPNILPIKVGSILSEEVVAQIGEVALPAMPDALQFAYLATHGARHEWERLQWVCDIAVMVDGATEEELRKWLATAGRLGLTNPVTQALIMAQRLLGLELPAEVTRAYKRSRRIRYMVRYAERTALRRDARVQSSEKRPLDPGKWLYRMCVTGRAGYVWHEVRHSLVMLSGRIMAAGAFFR